MATDLTAVANKHRFNRSTLSAGEWTRLINALSAAHTKGWNDGYKSALQNDLLAVEK